MTVLHDMGGMSWEQHVAEASRDQAEAIYQSLLREAFAQATPEEATALERLDALPRREALARLTTDLWPGHASPVPADLALALSETMRTLDPQTYAEQPEPGRTIHLG